MRGPTKDKGKVKTFACRLIQAARNHKPRPRPYFPHGSCTWTTAIACCSCRAASCPRLPPPFRADARAPEHGGVHRLPAHGSAVVHPCAPPELGARSFRERAVHARLRSGRRVHRRRRWGSGAPGTASPTRGRGGGGSAPRRLPRARVHVRVAPHTRDS